MARFKVGLSGGASASIDGDSFEMTKAGDTGYEPGSLVVYEGDRVVELYRPAVWHGVWKIAAEPGKVSVAIASADGFEGFE